MSFDTQRSYAMELVLLADNDYQIYRSRVEPITKNLERKIARGIFKKELAIKLVKYLMDEVAEKYAIHYGSGDHTPHDQHNCILYNCFRGKWFELFTPSDRRLASAIWVDQFLANRESS